MSEFTELIARNWRLLAEIFVISGLLYYVVRRFASPEWARLIAILGVLAIVLILLSRSLQLVIVPWLVVAGAVLFTVAVMVGFQPELRRILADLGNRGFLLFSEGKDRDFPDRLADAVRQLGAKRYGALFAIERGIELRPHVETGVRIDAVFSTELMLTLFHPKTALHDGGIVLRDGRAIGAGCLFPVSQREIADRSIGLRHRAGLGITEESDAIAIIVSEETGDISIAHGGVLERHLEPEEFHKRLLELLEITAADDEEEKNEPAASASDPPRPRRKTSPSDSTLLSGG